MIADSFDRDFIFGTCTILFKNRLPASTQSLLSSSVKAFLSIESRYSYAQSVFRDHATCGYFLNIFAYKLTSSVVANAAIHSVGLIT